MGDGIEQDAELAVFWFKLSAEQGDSEAQLWLAICYVTGEGVEEDGALGLNYMKLSAENGNSIAQGYFKRKADEKGDPKVVEFPNQKLNSDQWLQTMIQQFEAGPPELKASFLASIGTPVHVFNQSLSKLVETDENQEIEFKETFSVPTKTDKNGQTVRSDIIRNAALQEIAGFLNTNDGVLLIGIADAKNTQSKKPEIRGIEHDNFNGDRDKYSRTILDLVKSAFGETATSLVELNYEFRDKKTVCVIKCRKSPEPVYCRYKGFGEKPYIRIGSATSEPVQKEWIRWVNNKF